MDVMRFTQISQNAGGGDEDLLLFHSETTLDPDMERIGLENDFLAWIEEQGDRYLAPKAAAPAPEEIDELSAEIDF